VNTVWTWCSDSHNFFTTNPAYTEPKPRCICGGGRTFPGKSRRVLAVRRYTWAGEGSQRSEGSDSNTIQSPLLVVSCPFTPSYRICVHHRHGRDTSAAVGDVVPDYIAVGALCRKLDCCPRVALKAKVMIAFDETAAEQVNRHVPR
jgi:hypothetical protein